MSEGLTQIGYGTFENCYALASLELPESLETIDNYSFYNCSSLQSIEFPRSLRKIGCSAFSGCSSLSSITIPEFVYNLDADAFNGCTSLKKVIIEDGEEDLFTNRAPFGGCPLEDVYIGRKINIMSGYTPNAGDPNPNFGFWFKSPFNGCTKLKQVEIGSSVPHLCKDMGTNAGGSFEKCNLTLVRSYAKEPPEANENDFEKSTYEQAILEVYESSIAKYRAHSVWKLFKNIRTIPIPSDKPTSIKGVEDDSDPTFNVEGGEIVVNSGVTVEVYSLTGTRVAVANGGRVSGLPRGIYLVRIGGKTYKVAL